MITTMSLIISCLVLTLVLVASFNIIKNILLKYRKHTTKLILKNAEVHESKMHYYLISGYDQNNQYLTNLEVKGFPLVTREENGSQTIVIYKTTNYYFG